MYKINVENKRKELISEKNNYLTIIDVLYVIHGSIRIQCICNCGNMYECYYHNFKSGSTKSCGCLQDYNFIDRMGQYIDNTLFIDRVCKHDGRTYWRCKCRCGNIFICNTTKICRVKKEKRFFGCPSCSRKAGYTKSRLNLINKIFGRLKVIEILPSVNQRSIVRCLCKCGNIVEIDQGRMISGGVKSCGCLAKEVESLSGIISCKRKLFGDKSRWCYVKNNSTIPMRSSFEIMFVHYLDNNNIEWIYEPEVFKLDNGVRYCPDFYIPSEKKYYEIKGYMNENSKRKIELFTKKGNKLKIMFQKDIEEKLGISYSKFIKQWKKERNLNV